MKKLMIFCLCLCLTFAFYGCGDKEEEEYFETTLSFEKDGRVTDAIVESFAKDYYSEEGLRAFFQEKISEYNSSNIGGDDVTLSELVIENGIARATLDFENTDAYTSFYGQTLFYGTISDAYDKGYIQETVLKKVGASDTISKVDLMKMSNETIIVVGEVVRIHSPKKIEYTSANIELIDDKNARVSSDSTGLAYLIVK